MSDEDLQKVAPDVLHSRKGPTYDCDALLPRSFQATGPGTRDMCSNDVKEGQHREAKLFTRYQVTGANT